MFLLNFPSIYKCLAEQVRKTQTNYIPRFVSLSKYDMVVMDDFTTNPKEQFRYQAVLEKKTQKQRDYKPFEKLTSARL